MRMVDRGLADASQLSLNTQTVAISGAVAGLQDEQRQVGSPAHPAIHLHSFLLDVVMRSYVFIRSLSSESVMVVCELLSR